MTIRFTGPLPPSSQALQNCDVPLPHCQSIFSGPHPPPLNTLLVTTDPPSVLPENHMIPPLPKSSNPPPPPTISNEWSFICLFHFFWMLQVSSSVLLLEATRRINTQGLFGHVLGVKMTNTLPQPQGIKRSAFPFVRNSFLSQ